MIFMQIAVGILSIIGMVGVASAQAKEVQFPSFAYSGGLYNGQTIQADENANNIVVKKNESEIIIRHIRVETLQSDETASRSLLTTFVIVTSKFQKTMSENLSGKAVQNEELTEATYEYVQLNFEGKYQSYKTQGGKITKTGNHWQFEAIPTKSVTNFIADLNDTEEKQLYAISGSLYFNPGKSVIATNREILVEFLGRVSIFLPSIAKGSYAVGVLESLVKFWGLDEWKSKIMSDKSNCLCGISDKMVEFDRNSRTRYIERGKETPRPPNAPRNLRMVP